MKRAVSKFSESLKGHGKGKLSCDFCPQTCFFFQPSYSRLPMPLISVVDPLAFSGRLKFLPVVDSISSTDRFQFLPPVDSISSFVRLLVYP